MSRLEAGGPLASEDRVDVLGVVAHVEQRHELVVRQELPDLLVGAAQRQEQALPRHLHGVALDGRVEISRLMPFWVSASSTRCSQPAQ